MTMHEDGIKWDKMKIYNARRKIMMSLHETMHWSEIKDNITWDKMKGIELALCNIHAQWKGHDHAWSQLKVAFYEKGNDNPCSGIKIALLKWDIKIKNMQMHEAKLRSHYMR